MTFPSLPLGDGPALAASFAAVIVLFTAIWAIHVKIEDASIVDYVWGPGFVLAGAVAALTMETRTWVAVSLLGAVALWAIRLTVHLVGRHQGSGEDPRYRAMREAGGATFWRRALWSVFWLQAVILWLLALPLVASFRWAAAEPVTAAVIAGFALFAAGLVIETVADRQLATWRRDPRNAGKLLTRGLFAWSRHPNYFGEALLWWGIGLAAAGITRSALPLLSPLAITALLLFVSGIPLVERRMAAARPDYAAWRAATSPFVPMPPRLWRALRGK
ncbi:DUF1295 domain-containing protein [Methylobrevis albus]|uniref:DUF1295 domain-containing protein n=1 Tax=Methylobrevis albus TaxID=2793297 RepID=A0A931I5T4_9HYPH|nr:DUF1295 domain-containing protein [Methylobrevis albus]MBH0239989.1 DUF1295 domain-containing protein [Methylobrevis albus]